MLSTEAPPPSLVGSALASGRSVLKLALSDMGAAPGLLSQPEATPATSPLPKPCYVNPIQLDTSTKIKILYSHHTDLQRSSPASLVKPAVALSAKKISVSR